MPWALCTGSSISEEIWVRKHVWASDFVCSKSECVHTKGAHGCVSVLGTDTERVYECVSISVRLLISHRTSAEVPCCWADSCSGGWVQPPAHTESAAAGFAQGPRDNSSPRPVLVLCSICLFLLCFPNKYCLCLLRCQHSWSLNNLRAWPWWNFDNLLSLRNQGFPSASPFFLVHLITANTPRERLNGLRGLWLTL